MSRSLANPQLKIVLEHYVAMKALYLKGLELGDKVFNVSIGEIPKIIEERNRILNRIGELQVIAEELIEKEKFSGGELAQLQEARHQIKDLKPQFNDQLYKMNKFFMPKLKEKRSEMIDANKQSRAALAYVKSPGYFKGSN